MLHALATRHPDASELIFVEDKLSTLEKVKVYNFVDLGRFALRGRLAILLYLFEENNRFNSRHGYFVVAGHCFACWFACRVLPSA